MRTKFFYCSSFIICLLITMGIKIFREKLYGISEFIDICLGSTPSFFYLFGLMSLFAIFNKHSSISSLFMNSFIIMLGALTYEAEQFWTSRFFDLFDVFATILAFIIFLFMHIGNIKMKKNITNEDLNRLV